MSAQIQTLLVVKNVRCGFAYNGTISFDHMLFGYSIEFVTHIENLEEVIVEGEGDKNYDRMCTFSMRKPVDATDSVFLTDQQRLLLVSVIMPMVFEFYEHQKSKDSGEGVLGRIFAGDEALSKSVPMESISYEAGAQLERSPVLDEFLRQFPLPA